MFSAAAFLCCLCEHVLCFIFINFICGRKFLAKRLMIILLGENHQKPIWEGCKEMVQNINLNHIHFFFTKKTFQIISFSIHIYFFLFENTINTLFMLSWAWFFWSDWFCNSGFWIGASEISFEMKWFVTLYMSHVTFSWNIMIGQQIVWRIWHFHEKMNCLGPPWKWNYFVWFCL